MVLSLLGPLGIDGLSGLAKGGGFGLGYGFGVRAGYDAYGSVKDALFKDATVSRYSTDSFLSHLGSGILQGLNIGK